METTYAKIEDNIVTSVEVVEDDFYNANPTRYSGTWIKVGVGTDIINCGVGYSYSNSNFIPPQPFDSWTLVDDAWTAPETKPTGNCLWDEDNLTWITI